MEALVEGKEASSRQSRQPKSPGDRLRVAFLGILLVWCCWAFGAEVLVFAREYRRPPDSPQPAEWRLPSDGARELALFLEQARSELSPVSVVIAATGQGSEADPFFLCQWMAYLLPRHRVMCLSHPLAATAGEYLIAYQGPIDHPRLTEIYRHRLGRVYRVEPQ